MAGAIPNSWLRLQPQPSNTTLSEGLQARTADPLWLLTRQLSFSEFTGTDAGSPIVASLNLDTSRLDQLVTDVDVDGRPHRPVDLTEAPLEALVEAEPEPGTRSPTDPSAPPPRPLAAAQAGLHYLRLLNTTPNTNDLTIYRDGLIARHPIPEPPHQPTAGEPPPATGAEPLLRAFAGRVPNGQTLAAELATVRDNPPTLPPEPPRGPANDAAIIGAAQRWLDWYDATSGASVGIPLTQQRTWSPTRMEYQFTLSSPGPVTETFLSCREYPGDGLDWWDFDLAATPDNRLVSSPRHDPAPPPAHDEPPPPRLDAPQANEARSLTTLSSPVHYPGAPSLRWWEFEDAAINLGDLTTTAESLTTSLLIDYLISYGGNHHLVPLTLPVGTLCRASRLLVTDTFGRSIRIRPVAELEPDGAFRLFEHTNINRDAGRDPLMVLFPTTLDTVHGEPVEDVNYIRDEIADLVWAVETKTLGPAGNRIDRAGQGTPDEAPTGNPANHPATASFYYLRNHIDDNWFAFTLPVDDSTQMPFAVIPPLDDSLPPRPWSVTLSEQAGGIPAEEVTSVGLRVTRAWRSARSPDGRHHTWIARRTATINGTPPSPGLRWDYDDA